MKNNKLYAILMAAIMALATGCGNTEDTSRTETIMTEGSASETVEMGKSDVVDKEMAESESSSTEAKDINSMIVEKDDSELDLKEYYYSMEDRTFCDTGEDIFGSIRFDETNLTNYVTTGKVPIYAQNGVRIGYTNENVDIIVMGTYEDWCRFYLYKDIRYARLSDIEANSITMDERDAIAMAEEASKQEQASAGTEIPVENVPAENPVADVPPANEPVETPVENDKYTPEEAMSVYRSLMEAGGITWNPALKDGGSWGTGWIYLDKGQAEWAASTDLESFAIGNHGGNSWTEFYFEVTSSDEEAVYYTIWRP